MDFKCSYTMQDKVIINQISYDLEEILKDSWHRLINGANSARHPFHCPSIATINEGCPEIRTVVLRKVIPTERVLIFHTDLRSPKMNQIKINNAVSWLFYDSKSRIQLRIKTTATIHHNDDISLKQWNNSRVESRNCYLVQPAPSAMATFPTDGLPENLSITGLTEESIASGYENFVVVRTQVAEIDWLILHHGGHRRAQFQFGDHTVAKYWVVP